MNNLPKHHGAGPPEARDPMQLHRLRWLKAGPGWSKYKITSKYYTNKVAYTHNSNWFFVLMFAQCFGMLKVRESKISLPKFAGGTAHFRNLGGKLVSKNAFCWQQCFFFTHAPFEARRNNGRAEGAAKG